MKATIIAFLLVSLMPVSLMAKQMKSFSMVEVAKHNTVKSCWIVVEKKVYDVTGMIPHHNPIIQKQCGKDATEGFKTQGWSGGTHSKNAHDLQKTKQVGTLRGEAMFNPQTITGMMTFVSMITTISLMAVFKKPKWHMAIGRVTFVIGIIHVGFVGYKQYMLYNM